MDYIVNTLSNLIHQTAFFNLTWGNYVMVAVACFFLFLAIKKEYEPLLLVPIAFGMLLANIPGANLAVQYHDMEGFIQLVAHGRVWDEAANQWITGLTPGLMDFLYFGVKAGVYPPLIFLGIGSMTDFTPLIANL